MSPAPLSVVVPVYRDTPALAALLERLRPQLGDTDEVIVVDGADDPDCAMLCRAHGVRRLATHPCRGAQLDAGAAAARGEHLWFLHADSVPVTGAADAVRWALAAGAAGGYFRFRFEGPRNLPRRALERAIALRARLGVPYGDQGLFAARAAYDAAGGFAPEPLFEEVQLVRGLRRVGRFVALDVPLGVSPRRWERDGWFRRTLTNRLLATGHALGIAPRTLVRWYGPPARRRGSE